jgi:hypothetical protein
MIPYTNGNGSDPQIGLDDRAMFGAGEDPKIIEDRIRNTVNDLIEGLKKEKGKAEQGLAALYQQASRPPSITARSSGQADIHVRSGFWGKNKQDLKRVDAAKSIDDLWKLLGQYSTEHAKLAVLLHQLLMHAYYTMIETNYDMPPELQDFGRAITLMNMSILTSVDKEAMTMFGALSMEEITRAIKG